MSAKPPVVEERLKEIVKWGEATARHVEGMSFGAFLDDEKTQHAVSKCAEAVGEAAKDILEADPEFDSSHSDLKLKLAARSRDRLAHGYRSVDLNVLWNTATVSIPATTTAAKTILGQPGFVPKTKG